MNSKCATEFLSCTLARRVRRANCLLHRGTASATLLFLLAAALSCSTFAASAAGQDSSQLTPLEKSLALAYWSDSRFARFEDGAPLSIDEQREVDRLVNQLANFDRRVFYASPGKPVSTADLASAPAQLRGKAVRFQGTATRVSDNQSDGEASQAESSSILFCEAYDENGPGLIATNSVPARWKLIEQLDEPIAVDGLFIKLVELGDGRLAPLIAARSIEWTPKNWSPPAVNYGMSILGILGHDVATFDNVVHRAPLERSETAAFYQLLANMHSATPIDLVNWAKRHAPRHHSSWLVKLESTDLNQRALAREVVRLAENDQYSVAPFFNEPREHVGQMVVFDGVVRRALRIEVQNDLDAEAVGIDHYYELALFTDDSQNNPVMFCVLEVPPEMPLGDDIRQPVRLAGFFFKNWRYASRQAEQGGQQYRFAPMFVGRAPLRIVPSPEEPIWGWIAGLSFVAVVLLVWLTGWRRARADRAFADSTLARIKQPAEPVDFPQSELPGTSE